MNLKWDGDLPQDCAKDFEQWKSSTSALSNYAFLEAVSQGPAMAVEWSDDASVFKYGSLIYLKVISQLVAHIISFLGKSHVAPLKVCIYSTTLTDFGLSRKPQSLNLNDLDAAKVEVFFWTHLMTALPEDQVTDHHSRCV